MDTSLAKARVTQEEFLRWQQDPVTAWVVEALNSRAEQHRLTWEQASWGQGVSDEKMLIELRTRADAYRAIGEVEYGDVCDSLGEEPVTE